MATQGFSLSGWFHRQHRAFSLSAQHSPYPACDGQRILTRRNRGSRYPVPESRRAGHMARQCMPHL